MQFTAETIAAYLGGEIAGDKNASVSEFAKIEEGRPGAISFLANPKYEHYIYETRSSIVIVSKDFKPASAVHTTLIKVEDPYSAFAGLLRLYDEHRPKPQGISPRASIAEDAEIGEDCYIGDFAVIESGAVIGNGSRIYPQCYIGTHVHIGNNTTLYAGVKIYEQCFVGNDVTLHAGAVIGADGFGFAPNPDGTYSKIPQLGNVVIEDNVEIGANSTIDRARFGRTWIKKGVKIDNLVHVAHNVIVGESSVLIGQCGIAGSAELGRGVIIAAQAGVNGHITLGDGSRVAGASAVQKSLPPGVSVFGTPAETDTEFFERHTLPRKVRRLADKIARLEEELAKLKQN